MEPWYVTGLTNGEGTFSVSFNLRQKLKTKIEVRPSFSLSLNQRDLRILEDLKVFFRVGFIRYSKFDNCYKYEVRDLTDLLRFVVPHFKSYPLKGVKVEDYGKFVEILEMMKRNFHLSSDYLPRIIELAYQMNPSGKRKLDQQSLLKHLVR